VDRFCFGDGEADTQSGPSGLQYRVLPLEYLDVLTIGRRGCREADVVDVGEGEPPGDLGV